MAVGQFALVVAVYNVAEYLPAFLESLRAQSYPLKDLEIVMVDDGSTDESAKIVEQWSRLHQPSLRLVRQENLGPGAARNAGLRLVSSTWVTFCDPDDVFHPRYFQEVADFLAGDSNGSAQLLATRLVQFSDGTATLRHTHPLGKKFRAGNALVDLDANPEYIQLHGPTAFLRTAILREHGLGFDARIRPKFEDSNLIGRYLAAADRPVLGIVSTARYLYRRNRQRGSSLVAGAWADPRAYEELPRYGYLGMLQAIQRRLDRVPAWAQYMVLYDLVWFYIDDKRMHSQTAGATPEQQESMHALLTEIIAMIDLEVIDTFSVVSQGWIFHNVLRTGYKTQDASPPLVQEWERDERRNTTRYSFLFHGSPPEEKIFIDGTPAVPAATKIRHHQVLGRTLIKERILVLSIDESSTLEIALDGVHTEVTRDRRVPLQPGRTPDQLPDFDLRPPALPSLISNPIRVRAERIASTLRRRRDNLVLRGILTGRGTVAEGRAAVRRRLARLDRRRQLRSRAAADQKLIARAAEEPAQSRYRDAWILMDRIGRADDNAEHLYRYLLRNRSDINAWFLLDPESPDWARLRAEGFRLVAYGSDEAVLLYLNAAYKISSHANGNVEFPVNKQRFGSGPARFVFLQHGVIKDDMSLWLNAKDIALMVTATAGEHDSIAGDGNNYKLTPHEVKPLGFARHDALLHAAGKSGLEGRRSILVAPTWRQYLSRELAAAGSDAARVEVFEHSEYGSAWLRLLRSPELREYCVRNGEQVIFLPHPELELMVPLLELPDHVVPTAYSGISVQKKLVEAHTLVTDHSSIAFDAAYAGARVVYMQPDGRGIFGGGHVYRKGYFDYVRDGLGPLAKDVEDAISMLSRVDAGELHAPYRERILRTFLHWDGRSCERITSAIEDLGRPAGTRPYERPA
ncbi:glycosyltransferase [Arthrobacter koreensis]|uniref:glycosyltransferase n=1 Tax=Arthrobacter koreensis TaxID=199136 RepID=UPI002DB82758|nr:glycosyltransferase [Arthrobacter koreensis]MEB7505087.1 CDP-glycerol:glycerophosphate glycerophosphotransferase [Arthrobacter koreensis]